MLPINLIRLSFNLSTQTRVKIKVMALDLGYRTLFPYT
jgi:hypothetical protein